MDFLNSEDKYKLLEENITDVIYVIDPGERFVYISPSVKPMFGYDPHELIGLTIDKFLSPQSYQAQKIGMQKALAEKRINQSEKLVMQIIKKDGTPTWVETHAKFIIDPSGNIQGIMGVARDVSDRIKIEQELKAKVEDMEKMIKLTVNRELAMVELKNENSKLKEKLAQLSQK